MKLTKCDKEHFYDVSKYACCPFCSGEYDITDEYIKSMKWKRLSAEHGGQPHLDTDENLIWVSYPWQSSGYLSVDKYLESSRNLVKIESNEISEQIFEILSKDFQKLILLPIFSKVRDNGKIPCIKWTCSLKKSSEFLTVQNRNVLVIDTYQLFNLVRYVECSESVNNEWLNTRNTPKHFLKYCLKIEEEHGKLTLDNIFESFGVSLEDIIKNNNPELNAGQIEELLKLTRELSQDDMYSFIFDGENINPEIAKNAVNYTAKVHEDYGITGILKTIIEALWGMEILSFQDEFIKNIENKHEGFSFKHFTRIKVLALTVIMPHVGIKQALDHSIDKEFKKLFALPLLEKIEKLTLDELNDLVEIVFASIVYSHEYLFIPAVHASFVLYETGLYKKQCRCIRYKTHTKDTIIFRNDVLGMQYRDLSNPDDLDLSKTDILFRHDTFIKDLFFNFKQKEGILRGLY